MTISTASKLELILCRAKTKETGSTRDAEEKITRRSHDLQIEAINKGVSELLNSSKSYNLFNLLGLQRLGNKYFINNMIIYTTSNRGDDYQKVKASQ